MATILDWLSWQQVYLSTLCDKTDSDQLRLGTSSGIPICPNCVTSSQLRVTYEARIAYSNRMIGAISVILLPFSRLQMTGDEPLLPEQMLNKISNASQCD